MDIGPVTFPCLCSTSVVIYQSLQTQCFLIRSPLGSDAVEPEEKGDGRHRSFIGNLLGEKCYTHVFVHTHACECVHLHEKHPRVCKSLLSSHQRAGSDMGFRPPSRGHPPGSSWCLWLSAFSYSLPHHTYLACLPKVANPAACKLAR